MNDQADVLGGGLLAGLRLELETEAADHGERLAGAGGDQMVNLGAGHGCLLPRRPGAPAPARTDLAAGAPGGGHGGAGRGVMFAMVKRKERPDAGRGEGIDEET